MAKSIFGSIKDFFKPVAWPDLWGIPGCILCFVPLTEPPLLPRVGKIKWYVIDRILYTIDSLGHIHVVGPLPNGYGVLS